MLKDKILDFAAFGFTNPDMIYDDLLSNPNAGNAYVIKDTTHDGSNHKTIIRNYNWA